MSVQVEEEKNDAEEVTPQEQELNQDFQLFYRFLAEKERLKWMNNLVSL
jgi:hypothetical protein